MFGGVSIVQLIAGSWCMWILCFLAVLAIGYILERGNTVRKWNRDDRKFRELDLDKLKDRIRHEGIDEKMKAEIANYKGPLPSLVRDFIAILNTLKERGTDISQENLNEELSGSIEKIRLSAEGKLTILGTLSNIAPLIGLLGTVLGIMRSFAEIAVTGSGGASVIAMGVAEALGTTVMGILIAVPCTITYNYYLQQMETLCSKAELERTDLWIAKEEFEKKDKK